MFILKRKFILFFIIYIYLIKANDQKQPFSYDMEYARTFKLNNGNIAIIGTKGIYIYDKTGKIRLNNITITKEEDIIKQIEDAYFTTFAQFEEGEEYIIIIVKQVIYLLDSEGNYQNYFQLTHSTEQIKFYTLVPYIDKDNNYNFILGFINRDRKAYLQYYTINTEDEDKNIAFIDDYIFGEDDGSIEQSNYDNGISCQIMYHHTKGNLLICFYLNYISPEEISSIAFKLENNIIEKVPNFNASYYDKSFLIQSVVSPDKKKSLVCYIRNRDWIDRTGFCAVYNIDENKFEKYNKYLSRICETTIEHITLNYFNETKEYILSCTDSSSAQINFVRFDQNFDVIKTESNQNDSTIVIEHNCHTISFYSIIFIGDKYNLIGQIYCDNQVGIALYSINDYLQKDNRPNESSEVELTDIDNQNFPSISETSQITDSFQNTSTLSGLKSESEILYTTAISQINKSTILYTTTISQLRESTFTTTNISQLNKSTIPYTILISQKESDFTFPFTNSTFLDISSIPQSTYLSKNTTFLDTDLSSVKSQSISSYISNTEIQSTYLESSTYFFHCDDYKNKAGTICSKTIPDGYFIFDIINKIIEKCHISCNTCNEGPKNNNNNNCASCKANFTLNINNNCIYNNNYYFDKIIDNIKFLLPNQLCPEDLPNEIIETKECVEYCTNEEFINRLCKINKITDNNIHIITEQLKSIINEITDSDYDVIIDGNNIIYEITTTTANNDHQNISLIDFGQCEKILKKHYKIDYLLVFKMDVKLSDSEPTYIEYEVYSPINKTKLDLSLCEKTQIDIYVPINLDNNTKDLYNSMNKNGIDILNKNDSFYKEICTSFTSDDGSDMTLNDRQATYYNENVYLCENNCIYVSYNSLNGKVNCKCQVKKEINEIKKIKYDKDLKSILDLKTISNIELIKCFKLTFSKEGLNNNYGCIILLIMISIFISLIIIYNINQKKYISKILRLALKVNNYGNPIKKKTLNIHNSSKQVKDSVDNTKNKQQSQSIRELIDDNISQNTNKLNANNNNITLQIKNYKNINIIKNTNIILGSKHHSNIYPKLNIKKKKKKKKKGEEDDISLYPIKVKKEKTINLKSSIYTDLELNSLLYEEAISIDKRTYCQYYWSLTKTKHIILSIFTPYIDYNLITIKIGLFIFSFCLYFAVNALFFTDKTMHKIYEDKGIFNFLYQLPQILYSTLISIFINTIIKRLALSDKFVIQLKKIKNKKEALHKSCELYKNLMIRFNLFFFISFVLLVFFWYYISTFCAVYKNTQIILICNTLICFFLTLIYPFAINLLPGVFRIPALKSKEKDKKTLYNIGNIIALI